MGPQGSWLAPTFFDSTFNQVCCPQRGCPVLGQPWETQQRGECARRMSLLEPLTGDPRLIFAPLTEPSVTRRGAPGGGDRRALGTSLVFI